MLGMYDSEFPNNKQTARKHEEKKGGGLGGRGKIFKVIPNLSMKFWRSQPPYLQGEPKVYEIRHFK